MGRILINKILKDLKYPQFNDITIPGEIWEDDNLSIIDALIYDMLCELSYEYKGSIVTTKKSMYRTFHYYLGISTKTVERSIKKLLDLNYIYIIEDDEASYYNLTRFSVNEIVDDMDNYVADNPDNVNFWMVKYIKDDKQRKYLEREFING